MKFSWLYAAAPLFVAGLAIALALFFYRLLPSNVVFGPDPGAGDSREAGKALIVLSTLLLQLLLAVGGLVVGWVVLRILGRFLTGGATLLESAKRVTLVMSNMVVLPQIILLYATLDIFVFNAYDRHLPSVLGFAIAVMLAGGVAIVALLGSAIGRSRVVK